MKEGTEYEDHLNLGLTGIYLPNTFQVAGCKFHLPDKKIGQLPLRQNQNYNLQSLQHPHQLKLPMGNLAWPFSIAGVRQNVAMFWHVGRGCGLQLPDVWQVISRGPALTNPESQVIERIVPSMYCPSVEAEILAMPFVGVRSGQFAKKNILETFSKLSVSKDY